MWTFVFPTHYVELTFYSAYTQLNKRLVGVPDFEAVYAGRWDWTAVVLLGSLDQMIRNLPRMRKSFNATQLGSWMSFWSKLWLRYPYQDRPRSPEAMLCSIRSGWYSRLLHISFPSHQSWTTLQCGDFGVGFLWFLIECSRKPSSDFLLYSVKKWTCKQKRNPGNKSNNRARLCRRWVLSDVRIL